MLRIIDVHQVSPGQVKVDEYVPFTFRLTEAIVPSPYLWRTGDFDRSLLEVKVDRRTNAVSGVTLTTFAGALEHEMGYDLSEISSVSGVPVIDATVFQNTLLDEKGEIRLISTGNTCAVLFGISQKPERRIRNGRAEFLEAGECLCGIAFNDLSPAELECIHSLVRS